MCKPSSGQRPLQLGERHLSELGYSTVETTILQISRCLFQSFALPESHGWLRAHQLSQSEFPGDTAPEIFSRTIEMVQGMRVSRKSTFRFSNPFCGHCARVLTPNERLMMSGLHAFMVGKPDDAMRHATLLCEGNDMQDYLGASERLTRCLRPLKATA